MLSSPVAAESGTARSSVWGAELVAILVLAGVAVIQAAYMLIRHKTYFAAPDNTTQFFAWYQKESAALHSGSIVLWDQNTLGGHSFVGETQTGVFYPLNLIWLLVLGNSFGIGPRSLDMLVVLHGLIGSVGMFALARSFNVGRPASALAGVVFAYTGIVQGRATGQTAIFFGLTLVPWALFFAHRQLETRQLRYGIGAGAAIGLAVLAGHLQPPFHAALLIVIFYVLAGPKTGESWRGQVGPRLSGLICTGVTAGIVAAPQLAYSLPYLDRAYRFVGTAAPVAPGGSVSFSTFTQLYAGAPDSILSLLDPQKYPVPDGNVLFIGLGALAVLLVGAVVVRDAVGSLMGRYRVAVWASLACGLLAMLGAWTWFSGALYVLPFVTEVRELARYSIMVHVCLCLLVAFVLEGLIRLEAAPRSGRRPRIIGALAAFVLADGVFLIVRSLPGTDDWFGIQVVLAGIALLILAGWHRLDARLRIGALGLVVLASSIQNATEGLGSTASPYYPTRYYARTPAITYAESTCRHHRTLVLDGALPVNVGDVFRGLRTQNGYGATMLVSYYDFINASPPTSREQTNLLDLRCIVSNQPLAVPGYQVGYRDPSGVTVYVDDHTSPLATLSFDPVPATTLMLTDRHLRYSFSLRRRTTVILSALAYPGWKLRLDGHSVDGMAFRVDGVAVFPEVAAGPGHHVLDYHWSGSPL